VTSKTFDISKRDVKPTEASCNARRVNDKLASLTGLEKVIVNDPISKIKLKCILRVSNHNILVLIAVFD
jgi:hypothetical protein